MFKNWVFEDKNPDENIITTLRRHPVVLVGGVFQFIFAVIVLSLVVYFFGFNLTTMLVVFVGFLIEFFLSFYYMYLWYNDLYVLTNQRLIDVDQNNLFSRVVSETFLEQVEDVTVESKGFMETVFGFGTVTIQTAGAKDNIILETVPSPFKIQQEITKAIYDIKDKKEKQRSTNMEKKNE